jgi:TonB family protein
LIQFDFDDRYADEAAVGHAISRRESVLLSIVTHGIVIALFLFGGRLAFFQPSPEELERRQQELAEQERLRRARFVFVEPRIETTAPPRLQADLSDVDRRAATPQPAPAPANPMPLSRGNSPELTEAAEAERARGPEAPPEPPAPDPKPPEPERPRLAEAESGLRRSPPVETPKAASGALGEALRNLQKYVQNQTFHNPQGGQTDPGTAIQFDTKGVEFGPWIRRFVAQVRRNWFVPQAAWAFRGRVVLQFNIHRDGRITDVVVVQPSEIDAFNRASYNAILGSNPTEPLPPEYPEDKAFFTVTFSYNEPLN